jgi:hypothetical protein
MYQNFIRYYCYLVYFIIIFSVTFIIFSINYIPDSQFMRGFQSGFIGRFVKNLPLDAKTAGAIIGYFFFLPFIFISVLLHGVRHLNFWQARLAAYLLLLFSLSNFNFINSAILIFIVYILHFKHKTFKGRFYNFNLNY